MRPDTLRGWLRREPFRHFRLHLTTGVAFDVRHPECVSVERDRAVITLVGPSRQLDISLLHIVYIEMIPPASSPSAN